MAIDDIENGESGASARTKLNESLEQASGLQSVSEGNIPMKGASVIEDSPLDVMPDRVRSAMRMEAPDAGSYQTGNFLISNAGFNIVATELATNRNFFPVAYESGETPAFEMFQDEGITPAAANKSETFSGENVQFAIVNANRGTANRYTLCVPDGSSEVTDCNITIRINSHTDDMPLFDFRRATGGLGFTLPANNTGSPMDVAIDLPRPAFFQENLTIYVTISAGDGQTLQLAGQTINIPTLGNQTIPYIQVRGRQSSETTLLSATQDAVYDIVNNIFTAGSNVTLTRDDTANTINVSVASSGEQPSPNRFNRPIETFTSTVDIDGNTDFERFDDTLALYAAANDQRLQFRLPTDATINGRYPVEFLILHQGGTSRITTGPLFDGPDNTIQIRAQGGEELRRNTETGALLQFSEVHRGDLATVTKASDDAPWIVSTVTLSSGALFLPDGIFNLSSNIVANFHQTLQFFVLSPQTNVSAGDAFRVGIGDENFGGFGVASGDVIVALQDNPSQVRSADNDDWLVIRNAHNNTISLTELGFLNTITESDSFTDERLMERSDVNDVRVFLSTGILDHAPFINPSSDSAGNPQADGVRYVGGDEDVSSGNEFHLTDFTKVGEPAGSTRFPNAFIYVDIDGSFDASDIDQVFVVVKDAQGEEVSRHNLMDDFRAVTLTGSSDTYYVFDTIGASDNYSSITYLAGYTLDVVYRATNRSFTLSEATNVVPAIADGALPISKLPPNVQALITADHSLTDAQEVILNGFQTGGTPTPWTAGDLYVRDTNASPTSDLGHYFNVGQTNGILANFGHTRNVTFVVPNFVSVTGLIRESDSQTLSVTRIGAITVQDNSVNPPRTFDGQGFTATLPASSFDINNPVGDVWRVNGTASNLELTGADDSFKVRISNLEQAVIDRFSPHDYVLPDVLQTFVHDVTVTTRTGTNWQTVPVANNQAELSRQFAALWDENRRTFGTDNYFDDLTGIQLLGYQSNNVFFYSDANDPLNTAFPGAQSYILNDNVRFRNQTGQSVISDSFRKIIGFDYALQRALETTDNPSMLRIGPSGTVPLLGLSHDEGLYLNIGRGDGGQRTRTVTRNLALLGGGSISYGFGTFGGLPTSGEALFTVPSPNDPLVTFPVTFRIKIRLDNNGNDEGTFEHDYVITAAGTDQAETQFTATHMVAGSPRSFTWAVRYEANHNHATFGQQQVLFIRDVNPESNPALTDYVSVEYDVTETYNVPATYARYPVNAGSGHDDFGLFDPTRWNTEHIEERNRVLLLLRPANLTDTSSDPEMAVQIIVDGEKDGPSNEGYVINLHRLASEFQFDDMSFGNTICAISHIQCYDYDAGHLIGEDGLLDFYNNAHRWLGRFRHPTETTDTFVFNGLAQFTGVIGGQDVRAEMQANGNGGYHWVFTEI